MKTLPGWALAAALFAFSAAAAAPITDEQLADLKVGKTTYGEVLARLGRPVTIETSSDGSRTLIYATVRTRVKAATFVPIVGLFAGGAKGMTTTDRFEFGPNGVLSKASTSASEIQCGVFGGCGSSAAGVAESGVPAVAARQLGPPPMNPAATPIAVLTPAAIPRAAEPSLPAAAKSPPKAAPRRPCIRILTDPSQNLC